MTNSRTDQINGHRERSRDERYAFALRSNPEIMTFAAQDAGKLYLSMGTRASRQLLLLNRKSRSRSQAESHPATVTIADLRERATRLWPAVGCGEFATAFGELRAATARI
jgi:hypothetical protein